MFNKCDRIHDNHQHRTYLAYTSYIILLDVTWHDKNKRKINKKKESCPYYSAYRFWRKRTRTFHIIHGKCKGFIPVCTNRHPVRPIRLCLNRYGALPKRTRHEQSTSASLRQLLTWKGSAILAAIWQKYVSRHQFGKGKTWVLIKMNRSLPCGGR